MAYGLWCAVRRCRAPRGSAVPLARGTCRLSTQRTPQGPPAPGPGPIGIPILERTRPCLCLNRVYLPGCVFDSPGQYY
eukprot:1574672-Prymnesium_polylepis.2